jgi:Zn-dependent M28 family amino/carboxypeptidase
MILSRLSVLALALVASLPALAQTPSPAADAGLPPNAAAAASDIDADRIRAHVKFLASDLLEGRGTGARGGDIAAEYIATQFALDGLKPAGDNGSYLQKVRFVGEHTEPDTSLAFVPATGEAVPLKLVDDYVAGNQTAAETADFEAPVVFVGYGIDAPEYQWDDYKGVDVKGKVLLMIVNEPRNVPGTDPKDPKFFNGEALTFYGRWVYKFEEAARKGAIGAMIIHREDLASYGWDVVKNSWTNEQVALADDKRPKLQMAAWVQLEVARVLLASAGKNLDEQFNAANTREFKPIELPIKLRAHIVSKVRRFESSNVVAILPGTAPGPAKQAVMYSAHYDHLGIDPNLPGDNIFNGAVDNGTGCGILLELARAYGEGKDKPLHPVIFASVTAEEKGLLGSKYLGEHLPIPAAQIALDLNYDAINPIGSSESIEVAGAERTTFYPTVEKTAKAFKLDIEPDSTPLAGHYYRSDHFSLARVGIPAFSINAGAKYAGHPREWGLDQAKDYVANHYHRPADQYTPSMDFTTDAELARFGYALGWQALSAPQTIGWQAGDEFESVRQRSEKTP